MDPRKAGTEAAAKLAGLTPEALAMLLGGSAGAAYGGLHEGLSNPEHSFMSVLLHTLGGGAGGAGLGYAGVRLGRAAHNPKSFQRGYLAGNTNAIKDALKDLL